jgi:oxygen-independent coproporphyrinogen III oxidase
MPKIGKTVSKSASLYFHIPFCSHKCPYCHFYVVPYREEFEKELLDGLEREWVWRKPLLEGKSIETIYFGGGTPSLINPSAYQRLLSMIGHQAEEITLEVNPETATLERMEQWLQSGINRLSIGVQTLDDDELHLLGRRHGAKKAIEAVLLAKQAGFDNISIDLMFELPTQTLKSWERTLDQAIALPITHLSLYNLTIEPHTQFFQQRKTLEPMLPDETARLDMLQMAVAKLAQGGLHRYEISAFAKEGFISRHNSGYWLARPFLGFGPSAFSYWEGKRFQNARSLHQWSKAIEKGSSPVDFEEELSPDAAFNELLAVQMRLLAGVDLIEFQRKHGDMPQPTSEAVQKLLSLKWVSFKDNTLFLTDEGQLFYDSVASEIV